VNAASQEILSIKLTSNDITSHITLHSRSIEMCVQNFLHCMFCSAWSGALVAVLNKNYDKHCRRLLQHVQKQTNYTANRELALSTVSRVQRQHLQRRLNKSVSYQIELLEECFVN
jgi:hypothetical protein